MGVEARSTSHGHLRELPTFLRERSLTLRKFARDKRGRTEGWAKGRKERKVGRERTGEERMRKGTGGEGAYSGRKERVEKESAKRPGREMKGELCRRRKGPQGSSGIF